MPCNFVKGILLFVSKHSDLSVHQLNIFTLLFNACLLVQNEIVLLVLHFEKFFQILVELNVLLNVDFITVHDNSKAVGYLICQVFLLFFVHLWHKLFIKFNILLVKEFASMLYLGKICIQRLLILANIALHSFVYLFKHSVRTSSDLTVVNNDFILVFDFCL